MRVIGIVGLPCSGRTEYIKSIIRNNISYISFDNEPNALKIIDCIKDNKYSRIYIIDDNFISASFRSKVYSIIKPHLRGYDDSISWIFFRKDPYRCKQLLKYRIDINKEKLDFYEISKKIDDSCAKYDYDHNYDALLVFRPPSQPIITPVI